MAMIPTLFFYELVLVALVWVFLMLYWLGPNDPAARVPGARPRPAAADTWGRGARTVPAWRPPCPRSPAPCRAGRRPLPAGSGRGPRHAPARGPLPPRAGPAVRPVWPWRAGPRGPVCRHRVVPRHGHDLLAPRGRSHADAGGGTVTAAHDALLAHAPGDQRRRRYCRSAGRRHRLLSLSLPWGIGVCNPYI